ncbi:restriction endonuclease subunit S [Patescibacteria group bacterium]|nr:restriction endonuclease subunit S [Patescibacteria group bacterium]
MAKETPKSKTTWRKVKLGEVGKIVTGKTPPTAEKDYFDGKFPFITPTDIINFNVRYDYVTTRFLSKKWFAKAKNLLIPRNSTCFVCIGSTIGKMCLVKEKSFTNQQINTLIAEKEKADPFFLFYLLKANQNHIVKEYGGGGAAKPIINKSTFENIKLSVPEDINEQKKIAAILSVFDDKIELNNKINQNLEQMAQAIFKEWFVSPSGEDKLPKGWEMVDAEKILIFEKGVEPGSAHYSENKKQGFVPFYRVRDLDKQDGVDVYISKEITKGRVCKESDVLLSLDATVGRVKFGCNGAFSSGIRKVYSKNDFIKNSFIYFWLKTPYVQNTILEHASGTTIFHAGNSLKYLKVLFNKTMIEKFQKLSEPNFNKILEIKNENQKLASLRDLLLPKLISGEIRA